MRQNCLRYGCQSSRDMKHAEIGGFSGDCKNSELRFILLLFKIAMTRLFLIILFFASQIHLLI